mgnify:CR=1 FL=1
MADFTTVSSAIAKAYGFAETPDSIIHAWEHVSGTLAKYSGLYFESISASEATTIRYQPFTSFLSVLLNVVKSCLRAMRLHQHVRDDDPEKEMKIKAQREDLDEQARAGKINLYWHQTGSLPLDIYRVDIYTPDLEYMIHETQERCPASLTGSCPWTLRFYHP